MFLNQLNGQVKESAYEVAQRTHGERPEQARANAVAQVPKRGDVAHANDEGYEDPEAVQEPVGEQDLKLVPGKERPDRLHSCLQPGAVVDEVLAVESANQVVEPVAYEGPEKSEQKGVGPFEQALVHERGSNKQGRLTFKESAERQRQIAILV